MIYILVLFITYNSLRFSQVFYDDSYFSFQEAVAVLVVAYGLEFGHKGLVPLHPAIQVL